MNNITMTVLTEDEFAYILNPVDPKTRLNQWGKKILEVGPKAFFLQPNEELDGGVREIYVL